MKGIKDRAEFLRGMRECSAGIPHTDQGEDYNEGYRFQYHKEQTLGSGDFN